MKTMSTLHTIAFFLAISMLPCAACAPLDDEIASDDLGEASQSLLTSDGTSGTPLCSGTCTATSTQTCDGFQKNCTASPGCGVTSAGSAGITVYSCITMPPRPRE